ncbi:MAG: SsrA-binding protein SmpB [Actinobacteria bacterium]|jgi:SsrA-binding protein|nr:SsrA-binding protein SmpB [Clostridia bacterium]TET15074.1 MAG: SsrA-binding protein SmpB [Actinomycetota bacterium]
MNRSKKRGGSLEDKVIIARNRKAFRDFFILNTYEAGIVLQGCEVKSIRNHRLNLRDSYSRIRNNELLLYNMHISPYSKSRAEDINPTKTRKLLMRRREIDKIAGKLTDRSLTLVPLRVYMIKNKVKVELALAKGKARRDKRRDIQNREHEIEIKRALKKY